MNWTEFLRQHIVADLFLDALPQPVTLDYVENYQSQVHEFERLRQNRLTMGFFRYRHNFQTPGRGNFKALDEAIDRLRTYKEDGNQEHLVDAANLLAVEFIHPTGHPAPHFSACDDARHAEPMDKA